MKIKDLNTVQENEVTPKAYDYETKNLKGLRILDGVVGDMVGKRKSDRIWKVVSEDGEFLLKFKDIRWLFKKENSYKEKSDIVSWGKRVKFRYDRSNLVLETYLEKALCKNSESAKVKVDQSIQTLMERFVVFNFAGRIRTKEFRKVDGWFCKDMVTDKIYLISSEQIEWLRNKQKGIEQKIKNRLAEKN